MPTQPFDIPADTPDDALTFLAALNSAAAVNPLDIDPEEIWVQMWGCLYIAVGIPLLHDLHGYSQVASDLEVCFWPDAAGRGRAVEGGWGDSGHPLDSQIKMHRGALAVTGTAMSTDDLAAVTFAWLHQQLARQLELHRWEGSEARRIVLSDSGDVVAKRGLRPWRRRGVVVEKLSVATTEKT